MWGYTCNTNISSGSSGYYKGIIYTDSDDSIVASGANPALAPDALKIWNIDWDTEYNGYRLVSPLTFGNNNYVAVLDYYTVLHPASFTTLSSGGAVVSSAATLLGKTVESGYIMDVSSAGLAMDTTVTSGGIMNVLSGGSATNIVASNGAHLGLTVAPDTYASGSYNSSAFIMSSASISNYTIHSGCTLDVLSGGSANNTTVDSSGGMNVLSGGTATNISASSGALLGLAVAPNTYASGSYGGTQFEVSANSITSYTVQSGCSLDVLTGGVASDTTVLFGGMLRFAGGTAQGLTTISSGGKMSVALPTTIGNGMNVSAATGAIVDFDISNLSPANTALINNLSLIQGAPDYSITVSEQEDSTRETGAFDFTFTKVIDGVDTTDYAVITIRKNGQITLFTTSMMGRVQLNEIPFDVSAVKGTIENKFRDAVGIYESLFDSVGYEILGLQLTVLKDGTPALVVTVLPTLVEIVDGYTWHYSELRSFIVRTVE